MAFFIGNFKISNTLLCFYHFEAENGMFEI